MQNTNTMYVSIVVPIYNSAQCVDELVRRIDAALPSESFIKELILVNDDSKDQSWKEIERIVKQNSWVQGINLMRNYGQHNALLTGINHAQYDIIVTLDDDLQHPPEDIPALLAKLTDDVDVVYGVPNSVKHSFIKRIGTKTIRWFISNLLGNKMAQQASSFRAFRTHLRKAFEEYSGDYVFIDGMLFWATTRFTSVQFTHHARKYGKTNYTLRKNFANMLNMITSFSVVPLQFASILGFFLMMVGLLTLGYVIWNYFGTNGSVKGFTFTAATIILFSGVQMFCLGIIGAYLARMHLRGQGKPVALIRNIIRNDPK